MGVQARTTHVSEIPVAKSWATSEATRRSMRSNRYRDTRPELRLRRALHRLGFRFRVDYRPLADLNRRADIAFTRLRVAVFVHGCFWHGCPEHYTAPMANATYWSEKVERNRARDAETVAALVDAGWKVIVIWEHQDLEGAVAAVVSVLSLVQAPEAPPRHSRGDS